MNEHEASIQYTQWNVMKYYYLSPHWCPATRFSPSSSSLAWQSSSGKVAADGPNTRSGVPHATTTVWVCFLGRLAIKRKTKWDRRLLLPQSERMQQISIGTWEGRVGCSEHRDHPRALTNSLVSFVWNLYNLTQGSGCRVSFVASTHSDSTSFLTK